MAWSKKKPAGGINLAAEDDVEDTLAPRLKTTAADLSRVFVIRSVFDKSAFSGSAFRPTLTA